MNFSFRSFTSGSPLLVSLLATACLAALPAHADMSNEPLTDILSEAGSAGLGLVGRVEMSPYRDAGSRFDLLPLYLYEGKRLFMHGNRVGLKLEDNAGQRFDVLVERRLEGSPISDAPASLSGMALRSTGVDLGLAWRYRQPWGTVQAELLHDAARDNRGSEIRLSYSKQWRSGAWMLTPSLTLAARDAKLNNYYYGVRADEATVDRPAYAAGGGINTSVALHSSYQLSAGWRMMGGVYATVLSNAVKNSPVVQRRVLPGVYLGAAYDFGSQDREWANTSSPTYFKLLHGKATEDGCHLAKIILAKCLTTAGENPTSITAIQVGKPFVSNFNGWPVDIVGYMGVAHHDDRGLQPNGLQLDLFMKAFYSGFPWSHKVKTRLGVGMGLSLAQRVPYIEASSQAINGEQTSRLLHHLDPTLDISLGDLIGSRRLKDTYVGFGVSHRSGMFRASRLLGNVYGGSNYIYSYVESAF